MSVRFQGGILSAKWMDLKVHCTKSMGISISVAPKYNLPEPQR